VLVDLFLSAVFCESMDKKLQESLHVGGNNSKLINVKNAKVFLIFNSLFFVLGCELLESNTFELCL
jgi:hypothetical protein